jgi:hypothetical protein
VKYPSANNSSAFKSIVLTKYNQTAPISVLGNVNGNKLPEQGHGPVVNNPPFQITHGGNPPHAPCQPTGTCDSDKRGHRHCDNWSWYLNFCYGYYFSDCCNDSSGCYDW